MTEIKIPSLSGKLVWLSLASASTAGIMLWSMSWPFAFAVLPIFAGVAALRFSPKIARLLLYIAVPGMSLLLIPIGIIGWVETLRGARPPYDLLGLTLFLAWTTGPALLLWCDAELIREALEERKRRMGCDQSTLGRES